MTEKSNFSMLVVLFISAFAAAFNENIVNVALVDIMAEFSVTAVTAQWLVTGYMIISAVIVTVIAFLLKRFSFRSVFMAACAVMAVGSLACMFVPTFALLLTFRLISGIGAGFFIPAMMSAILVLAPKNRLGSYLAIGGAMATLGPAFSPMLSGLMVTLFGWRFVFLIPLVTILVTLLAGAFFVKPLGPKEEMRLDAPSLVLAVVGLTVFVYGLSQVTGQVAVGIGALAIGLVLVALFVRRQGRIENPLLDMRPIHVKGFLPGCALVVCSMMVAFSSSVLLPLYYEGAAHTDAFLAGGLILAPAIANAVVAIFAGRIMDKRGEWPLLPVGFLIMTTGVALMAIFGRSGDSYLVVAASSIIAFASVGLTFSPSQTTGLKRLDNEINASGVCIMTTLVQTSTCLGPSLFVGVMSNAAAREALAGATGPQAQALGFSAAMIVAAVIACAAFICAFAHARASR